VASQVSPVCLVGVVSRIGVHRRFGRRGYGVPELAALLEGFVKKGIPATAGKVRNYLSGHYDGISSPTLTEEQVQRWFDGKEDPDQEARSILAKAAAQLKLQ